MRSIKKISTLLLIVFLVSIFFVSCDKLSKKNEEVVEIKAEKVIEKEPDKVISAVHEKKVEPEVTVVEKAEEVKETVEETVVTVAEEVKEKAVEVAEDAVEAVTEKVEELKKEAVETVEVAVNSVDEAAEEVKNEVVTVVEEKIAEVVEVVEKTPEVPAVTEPVAETTVSAEKEVYNPPETEKKVPEQKTSEGFVSLEIGAGASYYRLEWNEYKADMLKVSVPVYLNFATSKKFAISVYAKPAYLKELQKDEDSPALTVNSKAQTADYSLECGLGFKSSSDKFSLRANLGIDIFNKGTEIKDPKAMLNLQLIPSFRLGGSKLWISVPFEGSLFYKNKEKRAYGAGIYISLRPEKE